MINPQKAHRLRTKRKKGNITKPELAQLAEYEATVKPGRPSKKPAVPAPAPSTSTPAPSTSAPAPSTSAPSTPKIELPPISFGPVSPEQASAKPANGHAETRDQGSWTNGATKTPLSHATAGPTIVDPTVEAKAKENREKTAAMAMGVMLRANAYNAKNGGMIVPMSFIKMGANCMSICLEKYGAVPDLEKYSEAVAAGIGLVTCGQSAFLFLRSKKREGDVKKKADMAKRKEAAKTENKSTEPTDQNAFSGLDELGVDTDEFALTKPEIVR